MVFAGGFSGGPTFPDPEAVNESGDASVFAEADVRLGLADGCDSDWGGGTATGVGVQRQRVVPVEWEHSGSRYSSQLEM